MRKSFLIFPLVLIAISGCAPARPYSEPEPDYYSDLERSNIDGRWYHKNSPTVRDMMSGDTPQDPD